MRTFQLSSSVERWLGEQLTVRRTRLPDFSIPGEQYLWAKAQPTGGVYFFSKSCLSKVKDSTLDIIRSKKGRICFDLVDQDLKATPKSGADLHVCTSYAQRNAVERLMTSGQMGPGRTYMLLHNNDVRLENFSNNPLGHLAPVYVGLRQNLVLPDATAKSVKVFEVSDSSKFDETLRLLPDYNFHYAVRPLREADSEIYKPFLKGFVAAACGANIMVHRDTDDALHFLGPDYPYLVDRFDPDACAEILRRAERDFGGPDWDRALDVMASIRSQVAPRTIALRFGEMVSELLG